MNGPHVRNCLAQTSFGLFLCPCCIREFLDFPVIMASASQRAAALQELWTRDALGDGGDEIALPNAWVNRPALCKAQMKDPKVKEIIEVKRRDLDPEQGCKDSEWIRRRSTITKFDHNIYRYIANVGTRQRGHLPRWARA